MKILFVDYDGVLLPGDFVRSHPENVEVRAGFNDGTRNYYDHVFDPDCVAQLNRIVEETGCKLVLVTYWRRFFEIGVPYRKAIEQGVKAEHFHEDHTCPMKMSSIKAHDISMWLEDHPEVTHWIVVDDEHDVTAWLPGYRPEDALHDPRVFHVLTEFETGLTAEKADETIKRFADAKRVVKETA